VHVHTISSRGYSSTWFELISQFHRQPNQLRDIIAFAVRLLQQLDDIRIRKLEQSTSH
jgi:hypothetical protein